MAQVSSGKGPTVTKPLVRASPSSSKRPRDSSTKPSGQNLEVDRELVRPRRLACREGVDADGDHDSSG